MTNEDRPRDEQQADQPAETEVDGGAYIGNRPEMARETIPGGVQDEDERVSANQSRSSGEGKAEERVQGRGDEWPQGHREGSPRPPERS